MSGTVQPSREEIEEETEHFREANTPELKESLYVHDVYNQIASHFSQTRYKPWPLVSQFLEGLPKYSLGVDVGCGNGKYLNVDQDLYIVGSDYSTGLISQAMSLHRGESSNDVMVADGLHLPHPSLRFDFAISIAVVHHFSTRSRRQDAIREILRVLKPEGQALIYCWALEQENSRRGYHEGMNQDVLVPWVLLKRKKKKDRKPVKEDVSVKDDQESPRTKMRYYHLYKEGELPEDCTNAGGKVMKSGYEKDNWWTIVQKGAP
ncbi:DEKNAAC100064 [Brettanomyces naardenensis]|uniref:DEKNAAC100064 n=1 Tax=Brettanomyces naardenensis TaxID=13370 RepID=A0A448YFP8_BRENA|nr:DEKNAAC100064 [Brettanomyces naardenensis]